MDEARQTWRLLRILATALCFACLHPCSLAQDAQARSESLLDHARQLTDIRSPGSPPFQLKATFSFVGKDLERVEGTYTELWVSSSQWRREIAIGDARYIEIGGSGRHWILFPDGFPQEAEKLLPLVTVFPPVSHKFEFASVAEHSSGDLAAECAYTKPVMLDLQATFCFEKTSGLLMEEASPERRPQNIVRYSCSFRTFRKFGERLFPRDLNCFEDRHKGITVVVVDLSPQSSSDPARFVPPAGAAEIADCDGKFVPPKQTNWGFVTPDNAGFERPVPLIKVWFVVSPKGEPQYVRAMNVARGKFVNEFLRSIQTWRYSPGTCDGKPVPVALSLELPAVILQ